MSLKKFVSTISAVTVAASTFAGMAISASAEDAGYIIKTTPYAGISVNDGQTVSTGYKGEYALAPGTVGEQHIVISKEGYQTIDTTVNAADNDTTELKLTPNDGIVYQENFAYVNDTFGFAEDAGVSVQSGHLHYEGGKDTSCTGTLPETINLSGTLTTIRVNSRTDRNCYINLGPISIYLRAAGALIGSTGVLTRTADSIIQVYLPISDNNSHRPILYVNGVKDNSTFSRIGSREANTLGFENVGNQPRPDVYYIKVEKLANGDTPPETSDVTIADEAAENKSVTTTYLNGTQITLPKATGKDGHTFKGWSDGNNTYEEGNVVTVNGNVTYTAVYEQEQIPETTHNEAFTFDGANVEEGSGVWITVFSKSQAKVSQPEKIGTVDTEITSGDVKLAIIVTDLSSDYEVRSITIE